MIDKTTFDILRLYVPEELHNQMVVAGGYVADAHRASDVDLWILCQPALFQSAEGAMAKHERAILRWLHAEGIEFTPGGEYVGNGTKRLVATIPLGYSGKDVQILVTPAQDAQELVDWFDISTHAVGKTVEGVLVFGTNWTETDRQPRVCRWDTPAQTLARLHKLTQRYGTVPHAGDVQRLVDALAERSEAA